MRFGDPEAVVCRELTKLHEEVVRGPGIRARAAIRGHPRASAPSSSASPPTPRDADDGGRPRPYLGEMKRAGARRSPAAAEAARRFGVARQARLRGLGRRAGLKPRLRLEAPGRC